MTIFPCAGGKLNRRFLGKYRLAKGVQAVETKRASAVFGNGAIGNTRFVTTMITSGIRITFTTIRSNMDMPRGRPNGRIPHFCDLSGSVFIRSNGREVG